MVIEYTIADLEDVAKKVLANLDTKTIFIYGEMGAGKTTLIKALVKSLGSKEEASSPTYSLVNEYLLPNDKIYHFDLYRINDIEEAYSFGIEEYLYSNHWLLIEWPQLIEDIVPNHDTLEIVFNKQDKRNVKINSM